MNAQLLSIYNPQLVPLKFCFVLTYWIGMPASQAIPCFKYQHSFCFNQLLFPQ